MKLGFVGLGEAGSAVAAGAAGAGASVRGFDPRAGDPAFAQHFVGVAADGVELAESMKDLVAAADVVISFVPPASALAVAEEVAGLAAGGQVFVDANSVSPVTIAKMAAVLAESPAVFVDAAVMAAVSALRQRVPMLVSGSGAQDLAEALEPFGFDMAVIGPMPGAASAAKMVRSVIVKGTEALLVEAMAAASAYGVAGPVLDSLDVSFPGGTWRQRADYFAGRAVQHGRRRADELDEASAALRHVGVVPVVTAAAAERLRTAAEIVGTRTSQEAGYELLAAWMREGTSNAPS